MCLFCFHGSQRCAQYKVGEVVMRYHTLLKGKLNIVADGIIYSEVFTFV